MSPRFAAVALAAIAALAAGCSRCGAGAGAGADASGSDVTRPAASTGDAGAGGSEAGTLPAATPRPGPPATSSSGGPSPIAVAQRFVVGWASGRLDGLAEISDGQAAELVRRAAAGEAVDTPLGRLTPNRPLAQSYSFADRRATLLGDDVHRVELTMTARPREGSPITTRHVVEIRQRDGKVVAWTSPPDPEDGGV